LPPDTASQLSAFCEQNGIPFLDTFPAFRQRAESDNRGLYIPVDEHLDTEGHEVVAQAVTQWLAAKAGIK
jgi:lysophospholipase L1-like esterase